MRASGARTFSDGWAARAALFFSSPADYFPIVPPSPFLVPLPYLPSPLDAGHLLCVGSFWKAACHGIYRRWIVITAGGMGVSRLRVSIWNDNLTNCANKQLSHTSLSFSLWYPGDGGS